MSQVVSRIALASALGLVACGGADAEPDASDTEQALPTRIGLPTESVGRAQVWSSTSFFGDVKTLVGDVTGDGLDDIVAVSRDHVRVRRANPISHSFDAAEDWTKEAFYGDRVNALADIDGNGRLDLVVANSRGTGMVVRLSTGSSFGVPEDGIDLTSGIPFFGELDTLFADETGDGHVDAIAINKNDVIVRPYSYWWGHHLGAEQIWSTTAIGGNHANFTVPAGEGEPGLIAVSDSGIRSYRSNGSAFVTPGTLLFGAAFYGDDLTAVTQLRCGSLSNPANTYAPLALAVINSAAPFSAYLPLAYGAASSYPIVYNQPISTSFYGSHGTFFATLRHSSDVRFSSQPSLIRLTDTDVEVRDQPDCPAPT